MDMAVVVAVVGPKDSYKTRVIELLIQRLTSLGLKVAAAKHVHHVETIDRPGKDTWRYAKAGASLVVAVSESEVALIRRGVKAGLKEVLNIVEGEVDVVLIEGFKSEVLEDEHIIKVLAASKVEDLRELLAKAKPPVVGIAGPVVQGLTNLEGLALIDVDRGEIDEVVEAIKKALRAKGAVK
ncbi:MAG: molybdopterin-guanine dinucleotide biosynthesis protein B [Thermoprotei archaeon]|nr:MAG: molybdopterin-guanine dinucleotide biosynthesis protein B [Thermoprotei archaeon]